MMEKEEKDDTFTQLGEICSCGHLFDGHIVMAYDDPLDGGLMLCQELETCECVKTWSLQGRETTVNTVMPPGHVIAEYRQQLIVQRQAEEVIDGTATWTGSSVGRAPALQAGGRGFEPLPVHRVVIQVAEEAVCGTVISGFESRTTLAHLKRGSWSSLADLTCL
jgi:hypothetical protein